MEEIVPTLNIVAYLVANTLVTPERKNTPYYFLGGHGYTYDLTKEGKKKLVKDVATSTGYYTGNKQKPNTVVVVEDILSLVVPNAKSEVEAMLKGLQSILTLAAGHGSPYKNLYIITPHKELEFLSRQKLAFFEGEKEIKLGKHVLSVAEIKLARDCVELLLSITTDKATDRKVIFDLPAAAEGGLGNRLAAKQLEIAEVETIWSKEDKVSLTCIPRKEYETPETDFNRIVTASRWYFETNNPDAFFELHHGYRVYSFGRVEPDKNYYGKLTPDVTYSKLYTKTPISLLDKLFTFTVNKIKNPDGYLSAGDLSVVTGKDVARMLDTFPGYPQKNNLVSPITKNNGRPVLIELISPVMMSYRVREFLDGMDVVFESFMKRDEHNVFGYSTFYDITDEIFVKEVNGKGVSKVKLHPDFIPQKSTFKVMVKHQRVDKPIPIILSVGYDLPERNAFNSVEDPSVKVWVATDTRNENGLRYCTLVETDDFIYIHTSAAANLRVLTVAELGIKEGKTT